MNQHLVRVNAIAQVLSHGCALSDEQAAQLPSVRALQMAWVATGAAYNDALPADQGWRTCTEGWGVGDRGELLWATLTGRMRISASDEMIVLSIYAGPVEPDGEPRKVCEVAIDREGEVRWLEADPALIAGRIDRLDLIERVDRHWGRIIESACVGIINCGYRHRDMVAARALYGALLEMREMYYAEGLSGVQAQIARLATPEPVSIATTHPADDFEPDTEAI